MANQVVAQRVATMIRLARALMTRRRLALVVQNWPFLVMTSGVGIDVQSSLVRLSIAYRGRQ